MLGATDIMPTLLGMMNLADRLPETVKGKDYSEGILTGKYKKVKKPVVCSSSVREKRREYVQIATRM